MPNMSPQVKNMHIWGWWDGELVCHCIHSWTTLSNFVGVWVPRRPLKTLDKFDKVLYSVMNSDKTVFKLCFVCNPA